MKKEILVAGAAGWLGRIVVEKLVESGMKPRVLVRDLPQAKALFGQGAIYHQGDVRDIETLHPAMKDVETAISCIGSSTPVGKNCPKHVDYQGVANLVKAVSAQNVQRFILISSIAVTRPDHPLNGFGKVLDWKLRGEDVLRQSSLDYTIIRPGGLINTPGGQHGLKIDQGDHIMGTINREDVTIIVLHTLFFPKKLCVTFEVIETEQEDEINWLEAFTALSPD